MKTTDKKGVRNLIEWTCNPNFESCHRQILHLSMKHSFGEWKKKGFTTFHLACQNGHFNIADILIQTSAEHNIELNAKDIVYGKTAFHWACQYGQSKVAGMQR